MSRLPLEQMFRPSSFTRDPRFAGLHAEQHARAAHVPDPLGDAFQRGYAEGVAEARAEAAREAAERQAAERRIELAFSALDEETAAEMRERLRLTVLALCEHAIAPLAVDPEGLANRVERAVAMLQRSQDERRVLLHPQDLALVRDRLPADLKAEADPSVERGALRIETSDGGIEDGPAQWRRILAETFREC
ncbi:flagellar assembly protein H [Altererythrobacter sp. B11]|uniref:FliH/SctL family protein n=1 Tax=Altererythrobacter sp. B11 TaxID=2060312 RepID=UPI000DC73B25|nr:FliH/SctL family protein [Altererythrobacter sp. B11]BBC72153.1 flagellar assembly protein H [Altererythrobacter sp. B11]